MTPQIQLLYSIQSWEKKGIKALKNELIEEFSTYASSKDIRILSEALDFGEQEHAHQTRETGVMYFTHPIIVGLLMVSYQPRLPLLIATVLHDVIEDSLDPDIRKKVEETFGSEVKKLIEGASNVKVLGSKKQSKEETLKKIFAFSAQDARTLVIKVFDRLHNILTLRGKKSPEKRKKKIQETLDIYLPSVELMGLWDLKKMLEDACFMYLFPEKLSEVDNLRFSSLQEGEVMKHRYKKNFLCNSHL